MKRLRTTLLVIGFIVVIAAIGFVVNMNLKTDKDIQLDANEIASITLINNRIGQGKKITKPEDISAVCDLYNTTEMAIIENWTKELAKVGGISYTFRINDSSGTTKVIHYYDGSELAINDHVYEIHTTSFEEFWNLDYPAQKWNYKENKFAPTE
jgi:hypothetical protein